MQNKYEVLGVVGEGAYGIVYKCKNKENGKYVAIKKFKEIEDELVKKTMKRELKMLQQMNNENIVEFQDAFKRKGNLYLVFEFCEKNLLELLQENPQGLNPNLIRHLTYQLCKAIKYLHEKNIIHRDIKPENLLITDDLNVKLCDFGFARVLKTDPTERLTDYVATRWYRAPELLLSQGEYGKEVDFWAIGCIMGELVDGNPLFPGEDEMDQIHCIQKILGNLTEEQAELFGNNPLYQGKRLLNIVNPETLERRYLGKLSKNAINFMKGLLELDPKKRLNGETVFKHPYFKSLVEKERNFLEEEARRKESTERINKIHTLEINRSEQNIGLEGKIEQRKEEEKNLRKEKVIQEDRSLSKPKTGDDSLGTIHQIREPQNNQNNTQQLPQKHIKSLSKNISGTNSLTRMKKIKIVQQNQQNFKQNNNKNCSNNNLNIHLINGKNYVDENSIKGTDDNSYETYQIKKKSLSKEKGLNENKQSKDIKRPFEEVEELPIKSKSKSKEKISNKMATSINFNQSNVSNNLISFVNLNNNLNNNYLNNNFTPNVIDNAYKTFYKKNKKQNIYNIDLELNNYNNGYNSNDIRNCGVINEEDEFTKDEKIKLKQLALLYKPKKNSNYTKYKNGGSQNKNKYGNNKVSPNKNSGYNNKINKGYSTKSNFYLPMIPKRNYNSNNGSSFYNKNYYY